MPIAALSNDASRAILSTLVLNDAISVIKELIDNALDANASNITIEISANTLDIIQVKDNGGGIGVEDRQLLCKHGFTSKIRTFEDLAQLGGKFLGFRGEALASIAALSDSVSFITKVDGELVGTSLTFDSKGKLVSSASASHGTGTTVKVSNFLKSIPVRKQTALKHATKTLNSVKKLLFEYAFARPTVRIHFKVLKSGGDLKANWTFAPCADASNLNLLASKIVGKDVAAQCRQTSINSEDSDYTIDALLFKADADISKCCGVDPFISIDGRPLAVERGLLRDLGKIYKSRISNLLPEGTAVANKTFLLLRLQCPKGSYDVNIEPAKNEVMFENPGVIVNLFEQLCTTAYGEQGFQPSAGKERLKKRGDKDATFELLLAKTPPTAVHQAAVINPSPPLRSTERGRESKESSEQTNVLNELGSSELFSSTDEVEKQDLIALADRDDTRSNRYVLQEEDAMDLRVHNPFILTKVNALVRPPKISAPVNGEASTIAGHCEMERSINHDNLLSSPSPSTERNVPYQNPGPPNRPWRSQQARDEAIEENSLSSDTPLEQSGSRKTTLLDSWTKTINSSSPLQHPSTLAEVRCPEPMNLVHSTEVSTDAITPKQKLGCRPAGLQSNAQSAFRTPFKKRANIQSSSPPNAIRSSASTVSPTSTEPVKTMSPTNVPQYPGFESPRVAFGDELEEIMDFEHRKRTTILEHRTNAKRLIASRSLANGEEADENRESPGSERPVSPKRASRDPEMNVGSKFGGESDVVDDSNSDDIPAQPNSASFTQNPHFNRYRKAVQNLNERKVGGSIATESADRPSNETEDRLPSQPNDKDVHEQNIKMSPRDPRAHLIRSANRVVQNGAGRPKGSSTTKLPFETIEGHLATYTYVAVIEPERILYGKQILHSTRRLKEVDAYVQEGVISSDISGSPTSEERMGCWESQIRDLLGATINSDRSDTIVEDKSGAETS